MTNPNNLENAYSPSTDLHSFDSSPTIVFGAVNQRYKSYA